MVHHGSASQSNGKHANDAIHGAILPSDCAATCRERKRKTAGLHTALADCTVTTENAAQVSRFHPGLGDAT